MLLNYIIFLIVPLVSGSLDNFQVGFVDPSISEQKTFNELLDKFLKLEIDKKDVTGILSTFEKPFIKTFPCDKTDVNELVVNVVETRLSGFTVPEEHEGSLILGGTYSWQCKITTSSKGVITMDCDNTIKLNPDVLNPNEEKDPRVQEVDNVVILYHELLHGQLMLDAIASSEQWQKDVCNKTPSDKIDYSYSDKEHVTINPLQEEFTSQLVKQKGGAFFLEEITPKQTSNGKFSTIITERDTLPLPPNSGILVTYRGSNLEEPSVTFPENEIILSGTLQDLSKSATAWVYIFGDKFQEPVQTEQIPQWIKNNAKWWSSETITDIEFFRGIEYLIQNDIMLIQDVQQNSNPSTEIPSWIKNNAKWWSQDQISDGEFIAGIKYLIEAGIIAYQ